MLQIILPENLQATLADTNRTTLNSDETLAFLEIPRIELTSDRADPHTLFSLFTADIICAKTVFIR